MLPVKAAESSMFPVPPTVALGGSDCNRLGFASPKIWHVDTRPAPPGKAEGKSQFFSG